MADRNALLIPKAEVACLGRQRGVARSGFHAWRLRQQTPGMRVAKQARLTAETQAEFRVHPGVYGSRLIHQAVQV